MPTFEEVLASALQLPTADQIRLREVLPAQQRHDTPLQSGDDSADSSPFGAGSGGREIDTRPGGGHLFTVMLLPCSATEPGSAVMGRDLFISSRVPRTLRIPTTPACP